MNRRSFMGAVAAGAALGPNAGTAAEALGREGARFGPAGPRDEDYDGSDMWLRYVPVRDPHLLGQYRRQVTAVVVENADRNASYRHTPDLRMAPGSTERLMASTLEAAREELVRGLSGLLDRPVRALPRPGDVLPDGAVVVGTPESSQAVRRFL